jgi:CheY-like chemotaxis protein
MHMVPTRARLMRPLASVLLAAAMCAPAFAEEGGPAKPDANFPNADQARSYFAEGVNQYRSGRYKDAAISLRSALALDPENKLVYEFYLACGDALVVRMQDQDVLEDVLKDVLRRARIYQKEMRRDPAYINLLIAKLEKSEEERVVATNELAAVGPWAVPQLVAAMADSPQEERRTYCRVALTRMGGRAVIPLGTALASADQRQVRSVALVLGDIGDARGLPALLRAQGREGIEDVTKQVLANTIAAIVAGTQMAEVPKAEDLHLAEALRYFRSGPDVRDELSGSGSLVWRWDPAAEGAAKLNFVRVPSYAWNELIAEEILFQGMAAYPQTAGFHPVLAAVYAAQQTEVDIRARLAKERTMPAGAAEDAADAIAERVTALVEAGHRVRMAGAENICRAIQQSLASERFDVAANLLRTLEDRELARPDEVLPSEEVGLTPDKPGSVLISALDHPEKLVRYQAAITLASLDPTIGKALDLASIKALAAQLEESVKKDQERRSGELVTQLKAALATTSARGFIGAEKVVTTLAQAIGEWGVRVVLVVDPDYRQRNAARAALQSKGFLVITAADGFEAINRLAESPVKDGVIIAGDLGPSLKDSHGALLDAPQQTAAGLLATLAADARLAGAPIFIALPDNPQKAAELQTAFEGKMPANGGFVGKPFDAVELHDKIDAALKQSQEPSVNQATAEDIALRAAIALQRPDPLRTGLDLGAAAEALVSTLDARADGLRIEALKALGHAASGPASAAIGAHANRLTDTYSTQDAELEKNPQLRAAWIYAIGQVTPTSEAAVGILKKALAHADAGVRAAAAGAVGASPIVPADLLAAYQQQQRLDVRAPGAGAP